MVSGCVITHHHSPLTTHTVLDLTGFFFVCCFSIPVQVARRRRLGHGEEAGHRRQAGAKAEAEAERGARSVEEASRETKKEK